MGNIGGRWEESFEDGSMIFESDCVANMDGVGTVTVEKLQAGGVMIIGELKMMKENDELLHETSNKIEIWENTYCCSTEAILQQGISCSTRIKTTTHQPSPSRKSLRKQV
eukprot:10218333-Ditylum_brightwellii.AAC.1